MTDMVRINHGLRPKYDQQLPASGFAILTEKIGVLQNNIRRSRLFKEREEQLFQVIKKLWNVHHSKAGQKKFSENSKLQVTYKAPEFPIDPKTKKEDLIMEQKILDSGDVISIQKLYPHLNEQDIVKMLKARRKYKLEQAKFEAEVQVEQTKILQEAGIFTAQMSSSASIGDSRSTSSSTVTSQPKQEEGSSKDVSKPKVDNRAKHAEKSSVQPNKNGDFRKKKEEE